MYNALARFVCSRSIVVCQNYWQITQQLPGNLIGGGKRLSWPFFDLSGRRSLPSRVSLARPVLSRAHDILLTTACHAGAG